MRPKYSLDINNNQQITLVIWNLNESISSNKQNFLEWFDQKYFNTKPIVSILENGFHKIYTLHGTCFGLDSKMLPNFYPALYFVFDFENNSSDKIYFTSEENLIIRLHVIKTENKLKLNDSHNNMFLYTTQPFKTKMQLLFWKNAIETKLSELFLDFGLDQH